MDAIKLGDDVLSDPVALAIVIGGLLFVVFVALVLWRRRKSVPRNTVLFVGLSDSGKTLVLSRFATGERVDTYTSMQENRCTMSAGGRDWQLVDVPGAERVRKALLAHWLRTEAKYAVAGIVFVVDSSTYGKQARDVAELLYELLADFPNKAKLLIACNKQDVPLAKSMLAMKNSLENELTLLGKTRAASLMSTDGDDTGGKKQLQLDTDGRFKWHCLAKPHVEFIECRAFDAQSASDDDLYDLDDMQQWIEQLR